jgi:hypothetical protein
MTSVETPYPGTTWQVQPAAISTGWDLDKLQRAAAYAHQLGSAAVMVVVNGMPTVAWAPSTGR